MKWNTILVIFRHNLLKKAITMQTFVLGDIHGNYKGLIQCTNRSGFNLEEDRLIFLGDVCDRGPETKKCLDYLCTVKNLVFIKGNHDIWLKKWFDNGYEDPIWVENGGVETLQSYKSGVPNSHKILLDKMVSTFIYDNSLFVHAGITSTVPFEEQGDSIFCYNRELAMKILNDEDPKINAFKNIYVGHTTLSKFGFEKPLKRFNVTLMDTGSGWRAKLSMLNIDTGVLTQSDSELF